MMQGYLNKGYFSSRKSINSLSNGSHNSKEPVNYYPFATDLKKIYDHNFNHHPSLSVEQSKLLDILLNYKKSNFIERFKNHDFLKIFGYMLIIDNLEAERKIRNYSLNNVHIYYYYNAPLDLQTRVRERMSKIMYEPIIYDRIYIAKATENIPFEDMEIESITITSSIYEMDGFKKFGKIDHIFEDIILFHLSNKKETGDFVMHHLYDMKFKQNQSWINLTYQTLLKMMELKPFLATFETENVYMNFSEKITNIKWLNSSIEDNIEQKIAVANILNCTSFPSPFIIFGGPGTGKSSTIVETISQIIRLKPKSYVLVTAGSNSACDDLGNRLLKYISEKDILRIFSISLKNKRNKIDEKLRKISNFSSNKCKNSFPLLAEILSARVVIVTLTSAGRYMPNLPVGHFDYIFIDEAGSVIEPQTYIPISVAGLFGEKIYSQIILSGDHKQIGPIVKNSFAEDLGLGVSLMERLMNTDQKYQRINNEYNYKFVVQLRQNYRNHPAIMHFSNKHFYNSKLIANKNSNNLLNSELLKIKPEFPIIFHKIRSPSKVAGTSLINTVELNVLIDYVERILRSQPFNTQAQESIGIISAYSAQRELIIKKIGTKYSKIEIGTVDSFQGREKNIIMVSCVRSATSDIGFLSNEKRLNVALTRAKSLLIIIGNDETLKISNIWEKFISYCKDNDAVVDDDVNLDIDQRFSMLRI